MPLGTKIQDKFVNLKKLVGGIHSGYCYQAFELVGTCRRIYAKYPELGLPETRARQRSFEGGRVILHAYDAVLERVRVALAEVKEAHASKAFGTATESLIFFCENYEVGEGDIAEKMMKEKERDDKVVKKVEELQAKKDAATLPTVFVTITVGGVKRTNGTSLPEYRDRLNGRFLRQSPLSLILWGLRKSGVTLDKNPHFYQPPEKLSRFEQIQARPLETLLEDCLLGTQVKGEVKLLVLVNDIGFLSVDAKDHYGITFDPIGKKNPVLKDNHGDLKAFNSFMSPTRMYTFEPERQSCQRLIRETMKNPGQHWLVTSQILTHDSSTQFEEGSKVQSAGGAETQSHRQRDEIGETDFDKSKHTAEIEKEPEQKMGGRQVEIEGHAKQRKRGWGDKFLKWIGY